MYIPFYLPHLQKEGYIWVIPRNTHLDLKLSWKLSKLSTSIVPILWRIMYTESGAADGWEGKDTRSHL